jgi:hypothetical protein
MTTPYSMGPLFGAARSFVLAGPAQEMLLAAATPETRWRRPCDGGAGFRVPIGDGAR